MEKYGEILDTFNEFYDINKQVFIDILVGNHENLQLCREKCIEECR
jgi:hypothetical protein